MSVINRALQGRVRSFQNEVSLHREMEAAFLGAGFVFKREVMVRGGRLDFLFDDGTALEVKVKLSGNQAVRQVIRYFDDPRVLYVIIVTFKPMEIPLKEYRLPDGTVRKIGVLELWRNSLM